MCLVSVHIDITRVFNNVLLQQTQTQDSHGEKTITALYNNWWDLLCLILEMCIFPDCNRRGLIVLRTYCNASLSKIWTNHRFCLVSNVTNLPISSHKTQVLFFFFFVTGIAISCYAECRQGTLCSPKLRGHLCPLPRRGQCPFLQRSSVMLMNWGPLQNS